MKNPLRIINFFYAFLALLLMNHTMNAQSIVELESKFPDPNYQKGVSGQYSGTLNDNYLMIAGGCNFPHKPASEGGEKVFYSSIFIAPIDLDSQELTWKKIGDLPMELAYGYTVQMGGSVLIIAGQNANEESNKVYSINFKDEKLNIEEFPSLPFAINNFTAVLANQSIYVLGGNVGGKASHTFLKLDLNKVEKGWENLDDFPGNPRIQAVSFSDENYLYLAGGFAIGTDDFKPSLNTDFIAYDLKENKWLEPQTILVEGKELSVGGGFAVNIDATTAYVSGGVNAEIFLKALNRIHETNELVKLDEKGNQAQIQKNREQGKFYMSQEPAWYQLNPYLLKFDEGKFSGAILKNKKLERAGATMASFGNQLYVIMGEIKPGVRTSSILKIKL